jgi:hypothetical protein
MLSDILWDFQHDIQKARPACLKKRQIANFVKTVEWYRPETTGMYQNIDFDNLVSLASRATTRHGLKSLMKEVDETLLKT